MDDPIECPRCNGKAIREEEWAAHLRWHGEYEPGVLDPLTLNRAAAVASSTPTADKPGGTREPGR